MIADGHNRVGVLHKSQHDLALSMVQGGVAREDAACLGHVVLFLADVCLEFVLCSFDLAEFVAEKIGEVKVIVFGVEVGFVVL